MSTNFKVVSIYQGPVFDAMRRAVYFPLFGKTWPARYTTTAEVALLEGKLRSLWVERVEKLGNVGWAPFVDIKNRTYAGNCYPFGFKADKVRRACSRASICPYCWVREYVRTAFVIVRDAAALVVELGREAVAIEFKRHRVWSRPDSAAPDWVSTTLLPGSFRNAHGRREVDSCKSLVGGVVLARYWADRRGIHYVRSGILILPKISDWHDPEPLPLAPNCQWDVKVRAVIDLNATALVAAVSRCFKYPAKPLLLFGDPAEQRLVLEASAKTRMFATYGPRGAIVKKVRGLRFQ